MTIERHWVAARDKVGFEGRCRVCRKRIGEAKIEAAHVLNREHDRRPGLREHGYIAVAFAKPDPTVVHPDRVVPLCGPATDPTTCHGQYDGHRLDLLPHLTREEQTQAVADVGIEAARRRVTGERNG